MSHCERKGPRHVVSGHASDGCDVIEADVQLEMAFNEPERFVDGIHATHTFGMT
jgi:hypothetical protein